MTTLNPKIPKSDDYTELRFHEQHKSLLLMVDGNLTINSHTNEAGASARVYNNGYWGLSALSGTSTKNGNMALDKARDNARVMSRFGAQKSNVSLPTDVYQGEHSFKGKAPVTQNE